MLSSSVSMTMSNSSSLELSNMQVSLEIFPHLQCLSQMSNHYPPPHPSNLFFLFSPAQPPSSQSPPYQPLFPEMAARTPPTDLPAHDPHHPECKVAEHGQQPSLPQPPTDRLGRVPLGDLVEQHYHHT